MIARLLAILIAMLPAGALAQSNLPIEYPFVLAPGVTGAGLF